MTPPDIPRWAEARGMLVARRGRIYASDMATGGAIILMHDGSLAVLTAPMPHAALSSALEVVRADAPWLVPADDARAHAGLCEVLDVGRDERAIIHALPADVLHRTRADREADVRWVMSPDAIDWSHVDADLRHELAAAFAFSPVAAAFDDGQAVSFCYAAFQTETLWDVSIDTIPRARGRGHARQVAAFLVAHMRDRGRRPVWGAVESNAASLALARTLGFVPVDALRVVTPRPPALRR
ncbi:MAG: GNAT family N-acetyltransferase [Acidobacteria bacterium]|nr:GNAT family N-acetyltransferase [Acidobacteriota bacterium]